MKKIRNLVIGGIENKVFNLILVTVLLTALAFMGGFLYQNKMLTDLSNESSRKQKDAIAETTGSIMDQVVTLSLNRNTETESMLVDEFFHGLQTGECISRVFRGAGSGQKRRDHSTADPGRGH